MAVSSRALFDLVEERRIFEEQGVEKYVEYQQDNENVTLKPGPAFYFVKVPGPGRAGLARRRCAAGRGGCCSDKFGEEAEPEASLGGDNPAPGKRFGDLGPQR